MRPDLLVLVLVPQYPAPALPPPTTNESFPSLLVLHRHLEHATCFLALVTARRISGLGLIGQRLLCCCMYIYKRRIRYIGAVPSSALNSSTTNVGSAHHKRLPSLFVLLCHLEHEGGKGLVPGVGDGTADLRVGLDWPMVALCCIYLRGARPSTHDESPSLSPYPLPPLRTSSPKGTCRLLPDHGIGIVQIQYCIATPAEDLRCPPLLYP